MDRLEEYRRVSAFNRYCGIDVQEISPGQVRKLPHLEGRRHLAPTAAHAAHAASEPGHVRGGQ